MALPAEDDERLSLADLLDELGRRPITHLLVEPGTTLGPGFLREDVADRIWVFRAPISQWTIRVPPRRRPSTGRQPPAWTWMGIG